MFSPQVFRLARLSVPIRTFVKASQPPPSTPNQKQGGPNTVLLATVTAAAGAAGVYWYLTQPQSFQELEATAKKREDEISRKARELADTSKARAEDLLKQSEQQYSDIKASGQDKLAAARARADSAASGAQAKYDSYKYPTLPDSRAAVTKDQTQGGWFDWLRWGRSKADQGKRDGAQKVVDAADEVRKRADEHK